MALAYVHKAAAIQSRPKTVLSMMLSDHASRYCHLRRGFQPFDIAIYKVWLHYLQNSTEQRSKSSEHSSVQQHLTGSYSTVRLDAVRMLPSAAARL